MFAVIITAYLNVSKPESTWLEYQRMAEKIKCEKLNFLMKVGSYSGSDSDIENEKQLGQMFVERIKSIISSENSR